MQTSFSISIEDWQSQEFQSIDLCANLDWFSAKKKSKSCFRIGDSDHTTNPSNKTRMKLAKTYNTKWYKQFNSTRLETPIDVLYKWRGYLTQNERIVDRNQSDQRIEIMKMESYFNHLKHCNLSFDK